MSVKMGRSRPRRSDDDLVKALIYCKHKDGELCDMCAFGRFAPHCADILIDAAVDRIRELQKQINIIEEAKT